MIRRPPRSTQSRSSAASDVYKRQITTGTPYSPSDGVRLALGGQVSAANLMVVSPSRQGPGVLLGALTNRTDAATTVTITNKVAIDGLAAPSSSDEFTVEVPLALSLIHISEPTRL